MSYPMPAPAYDGDRRDLELLLIQTVVRESAKLARHSYDTEQRNRVAALTDLAAGWFGPVPTLPADGLRVVAGEAA